MKLTLTIQDVKLKDTGDLVQMVFGTLNASAPDKDGTYDRKKNINFTVPLDNIKGLRKISRNIQVEALKLKQSVRFS